MYAEKIQNQGHPKLMNLLLKRFGFNEPSSGL